MEAETKPLGVFRRLGEGVRNLRECGARLPSAVAIILSRGRKRRPGRSAFHRFLGRSGRGRLSVSGVARLQEEAEGSEKKESAQGARKDYQKAATETESRAVVPDEEGRWTREVQ